MKSVLLLVGPKGAGKTTIGQLLALELGVRFLRVEPLFLQVRSALGPAHPDYERRGFEAVVSALVDALAGHDTVCLESTGASEHLPWLLSEIRKVARLHLVRVRASPAQCLDRIRGRDASLHIPVSDDQVGRINALAAAVDLPWSAEIENGGPFDGRGIVEQVRALLGPAVSATSRVTLRVPRAEDAEPLYDAVRESIAELHPWAPWCPLTYGLEDAVRWLDEQPAAREAGTAYEFVVTAPDGRLLGCCGVNQVNAGFRLANLGYWIRTSATGRGYATEAARQAAAWAFAHTNLERLELLVAVGNAASQAVALKAGAALEGCLRSRFLVHGRFQDAFVYSLIRPPAKPPA